MAPTLYSFRRCPYAIRARLALQTSGTAVELREIVLRDKPAELVLASAKATVPVLVLGDGAVIDQSLEIMLWALHRSDPQGWLLRDTVAMDDALACIAENDGPFKQQLDRYKYPHRYGLPAGTAPREQAAKFLAQLDQRLRKKTGLCGPAWCLADAAIAPFVRQFAATDRGWFEEQPWPALQRWLAGFEASTAFAGVMQRYPVWQPGQAPAITQFG
jgi:glutathione S-transferase